jgi:hypothetical protein
VLQKKIIKKKDKIEKLKKPTTSPFLLKAVRLLEE